MVALYNELKDEGFVIIGVNLRETAAKVEPFIKEYGIEFPVLLDESGQIGAAYYVRGIPTSVFINPEGTIEAVHVGLLTDELLRKYVSQLMQ